MVHLGLSIYYILRTRKFLDSYRRSAVITD